MVTIMVPLAPNPATNGYVMHMPTEKVHEVDLTVEEAFRSIATLGVVAADSPARPRAVPIDRGCCHPPSLGP